MLGVGRSHCKPWEADPLAGLESVLQAWGQGRGPLFDGAGGETDGSGDGCGDWDGEDGEGDEWG